MSQQRYQGQNRRGGRPYQYRYGSPRGPPRDHHNAYRPPHLAGPLPHREGAYANPHLTHSMTSLLGSVVEVKVISGIVYEGILTEFSPKLEIFLEEVHEKAKSAVRQNVEKQMRFSWTEIVNISAKEEPNRRYASSDIFKTDSEISQSNGSSGSRALQPFDFDEGSSVEHLDSDSTGWSVHDMFQVNKEKFDVSSTYDEEMAQYTTKLERDDTENFRQREARASRIAQEIEAKDNKKRLGVDDVGTEEELFSAVVRQEVAPPPPAETTPFRPNGGVPSISSESENVAPPPAAATVGVNSIPKTDSSSTSTGSNSSSKSELLSDSGIQPASGDSSAGLLDTPTTLAAAKDDSRSADSASAAKEVAEVKGQDAATKGTSEESATEQQTGKDERLVEEKLSAAEEPKTAIGAETPPPGKKEDEAVTPSGETKEKEDTIKTFKLNPDAKEFTPGSNFSLSSTPPTASSSPALSSSSSSTRSSSSTPYLGGGGKKGSFRGGGRPPRSQQHQQTSGSTYVQPELATFIPSPSSAVGQGGFVIQTQPFGLRPSVHTPPAAGQVYYTHVPQYPGAAGLIAQPGMIPPQQLVAAASPKFLTEVPTQPQVIGQHYPQTSQSPQFMQHLPGQALLQPTVSQQQLMPTPQGLVSAHQPLFSVVQGGLATGGTAGGVVTGAAATAGGLVGGVPFSPYAHHPALAAAASATQQPGGGGGAGGVASQPLAGTPVAPNRQLFQHQSHQVGK